MARLIIVSGASGAGKSFLLKELKNIHNLKAVTLRKMTTRTHRNDDEKIKNENGSLDLILNCSQEALQSCDYTYYYCGHHYGFKKKDIDNIVAKGNSPVVIVADCSTVEIIKKDYANALVLYVQNVLSGEDLKNVLIKERDPIEIDERMKRQQESFEDYVRHVEKKIFDYLDFYTDKAKGGIYLSEPNKELIQLYDQKDYPRGIFPRSCFYTTKYKRYSVWGFVFNRKGELLLHQRSDAKATIDNRGLWDKSIGGHVNILDKSSLQTAKSELIEELFLPNDIDTKHLRADLGHIVNFGDWNIAKRGEMQFKEAFDSLTKNDWIIFGATGDSGDPISISRISDRRFHFSEDNVKYRKTIFMSDVYFFIAPEGYIDTHEQMKELVKLSEKTGAASDHKLISIGNLRDWINKEKEKDTEKEVFTDDLLYINVELIPLLEKFSEFIKLIFF